MSALDDVIDDLHAKVRELEGQVKALRDPREQYGLALAIEQEKVKALCGAIEEAARLFVAITSHKVVFHDLFHAWLAHPTVTAARNERAVSSPRTDDADCRKCGHRLDTDLVHCEHCGETYARTAP